MTEALLKILAVAPGPQTATELHDGLRRSGIKVDEFQVLQELRRLQDVNVVRIEGTRWRLLKALPQRHNAVPKSTRSQGRHDLFYPTKTHHYTNSDHGSTSGSCRPLGTIPPPMPLLYGLFIAGGGPSVALLRQ